MNYLNFDFDIESQDQLEKLVALLADMGFEGFEETEGRLHAFIAEHDYHDTSFFEVMDVFPIVSYTKTQVENINWNKQWEENFNPVIVDGFVAIRAAFHEPVQQVTHEIIITPKMSFGTGHHATTCLMISQMRHIDFIGKSVLDFGTGTGILAILAAKLGAANIFAIDQDEWSIINARENIAQNNSSHIRIAQLDTIPITEKYDIILANINLNVIKTNIALIANSLLPAYVVLLSGFLRSDEPSVTELLDQAGLQYSATGQAGDWIVIIAKKQ